MKDGENESRLDVLGNSPSYISQAGLVQALWELDGAYGRAVRAARAAGEQTMFTSLDERWSSFEALVMPSLRAKPPALFK